VPPLNAAAQPVHRELTQHYVPRVDLFIVTLKIERPVRRRERFIDRASRLYATDW
jgi:hypothetical protein